MQTLLFFLNRYPLPFWDLNVVCTFYLVVFFVSFLFFKVLFGFLLSLYFLFNSLDSLREYD